jgi:hypothetical protein
MRKSVKRAAIWCHWFVKPGCLTPVACDSVRKSVRADGSPDFALVYIKVRVNVLNVVVLFKRFN